jgi:hypothetical protein
MRVGLPELLSWDISCHFVVEDPFVDGADSDKLRTREWRIFSQFGQKIYPGSGHLRVARATALECGFPQAGLAGLATASPTAAIPAERRPFDDSTLLLHHDGFE